MEVKNNSDYHIPRDLIDEVRTAGQKILSKGINPKFAMKKEPSRTPLYQLCSSIQKEAQFITRSGAHVRFVCSEEARYNANVQERYRNRIKERKEKS